MVKFLTLNDIELEDKTVLVRVDYNVPIKNGLVEDDTRLRATIPTINFLLEKNCKIILMSHLGRPQKLLNVKSLDEVRKELSLKPVSEDLSELLGIEVAFIDEYANFKFPKEKDIVLLENLRLSKGEETNDKEFAKKLASCADVYVNDAFGACHRAHASVSAITGFLPSFAGLLVEKEIKQLSKLLKPLKPFVAIVAGAKSDKIGALKALSKKADKILIAGVLANTFLKSKGVDICASKFDSETFDVAKDLIKVLGNKLVLPIDFVIGDKFSNSAETKTVDINKIPENCFAMDIGPNTIKKYKNELSKAKTVLWAGPLGVFEMPKFCKGTKQIGEFLGKLDAIVIVGGGDSASAVNSFDLADKMTHVSTGGGASLEFIEKEGKLPALLALERYYKKFNEN